MRTDGSTTRLGAALGGKAAVLVFYRGAWCPYCNIALQTYQRDLLPRLRDEDVELIAISPQTPEASEQTVRNGGLQFTVLADPANVWIRELGIITEPTSDARGAHTQLGFDVADSNADSTGDIPFPTVLVIDADRVVRFADVHVDYTTRTEVPDDPRGRRAALNPLPFWRYFCGLQNAQKYLHDVLRGGHAAVHVEGLARHVARLRAREEDVRGGELRRLAGTPERGLRAELGERLRRLAACGLQRGPDRARRDDVHPDALPGDGAGERLAEGVDLRLRARVVEQRRARRVRLHRTTC